MPEDKKLISSEDFKILLGVKLGYYTGKGMFENYPSNYNKLFPQMCNEVYAQLMLKEGDDIRII